MKCDNNNSPTNSGIKVALRKTGYGRVCIWNGVAYWDLNHEGLNMSVQCAHSTAWHEGTKATADLVNSVNVILVTC